MPVRDVAAEFAGVESDVTMLGAGERVVAEAGVPTDDRSDWGLVRNVAAFVEAMGKHRNWDRMTDPPRV